MNSFENIVAEMAKEAYEDTLAKKFMISQTKKFTLKDGGVDEIIAIAKKVTESGEVSLDELYVDVTDGFGYPGDFYVYYMYEIEMTGKELSQKRDSVFRAFLFSYTHHELVDAQGWQRIPVRSSLLAEYDNVNFFEAYQDGNLDILVRYLSLFFADEEQ